MEWKKFFRSHILDRGYDYYKQGLVEIKELTDDYVEASVLGTESYTVYIEFDDLRTMQCTCPHFGSGFFCKHLAAVLYTMEDKTAKKTESKSDLVEVCKEAINHAFEIVRGKKKEIPVFENELDRIIYLHTDKDGCIRKKEVKVLTGDLKTHYTKVIEPLLRVPVTQQSFDLVVDYYEHLVKICDVLDYQLFEDLKPLWRHLIASSEAEVHQYIFDWFNTKVEKSMLVHRDLKTFYCKYFNEPEFRETKVSVLNKKVLYFAYNDLQRREVIAYLEARLDLSESVFDYMSLYTSQAEMVEFFVFYMTKKQRQQETIDFLKACMEKYKEDKSYLKRVGAVLCHVYESCMMIPELKEELYQQLQTFNQGDMNIYHQLEKLYPKNEWEKIRESLLKEENS